MKLRFMPAIVSILAAAGCEAPAQPMPWDRKQIPITAPKEQTRVPTLFGTGDASSDKNAAGAPSAAGGADRSPSSRAAEGEPRIGMQRGGGSLAAPLRLTELPDVPPMPPAEPNSSAAAPAPPDPADRPVAYTPPLGILARPATPSPTPATAPLSPAAVVSALGLQVNSKYITVEDILRSAAGELAELPRGLKRETFQTQAEAILQRAIRFQIEVAIFLPEAEAKMTDEDKKKMDQEVDKTLRDMVAEAGGSRTRLEQIWMQRGTTLEQVLRDQRSRLVVSRYLRAKIEPDIQITRRMLYDYYQRHKADRYTQNKKVQMQILSVPFAAFLVSATPTRLQQDEAKEQARRAIAPAEKTLGDGADFTEIVKAFGRDSRAAQGGVWPLMAPGSFRQTRVEQAAFALREGQASPVIETEDGLYIVKAVKVEGGTVTSFEDAQEEIEKTLRADQYERLHEKYIQARSPSVSASRRLEELALEKAAERYWRK
jgi:parvulin-like peptidyl-prolyl isomerase